MHVLIVDFSYPKETIEIILTKAKSLMVLDHHETELADHPYCHIDPTKSGARLTWEYLRTLGYNPPTGSGGAHWLVDYTEDRDLWKHKLTNTHEINAAIRSYPLDFETWDKLAARTSYSLIPEGQALQRYKTATIEHHVRYARQTTIAGHQATIVNCTTPDICSDIADRLLKDHPHIPIAIVSIDTHNGTIYQIRSSRINVEEIAKAYGGGGHKAAAAFNLPNFTKNTTQIQGII